MTDAMAPVRSEGFFAALAPRGKAVLFALILTAHETPILTVVMAQFVHELGMEWHLMSATAVIALVPALIVTLFGQRYVIRGLRI